MLVKKKCLEPKQGPESLELFQDFGCHVQILLFWLIGVNFLEKPVLHSRVLGSHSKVRPHFSTQLVGRALNNH